MLNFLKSRVGIAVGYVKQRSPFDKTNYIENYIPRQTPYAKSRKPRQALWDDQSIWPIKYSSPIIPRVKLIKELEKEEIQRQQIIKPIYIPDFRVGDVVEVKWIHNMSEQNETRYEGLVVARRNKNSLEASFKLITKYCGVRAFLYIKIHSPYLRGLTILKRGSGNIRNKQAIWRNSLLKCKHQSPIVRGKMMRRREDPPKRRFVARSRGVLMQSRDDPLFQEKQKEAIVDEKVEDEKQEEENQKEEKQEKTTTITIKLDENFEEIKQPQDIKAEKQRKKSEKQKKMSTYQQQKEQTLGKNKKGKETNENKDK
ncbi:hypothetical protein pb186bvf_004210 [Paramecium bursaria]